LGLVKVLSEKLMNLVVVSAVNYVKTAVPIGFVHFYYHFSDIMSGIVLFQVFVEKPDELSGPFVEL
jgi:hypothetical protein